METFDALLAQERPIVERYVHYRIDAHADAEDILQEVYLAAYLHFPDLRNPSVFKAWLLRIAQNKCNDYFRRRTPTVSLDDIPESHLPTCHLTRGEDDPVTETMNRLGARDREILTLYFWQEMPQREMASRLGIPLGTVKSRLHTAKAHFRAAYPSVQPEQTGGNSMKNLPNTIPTYTIEAADDAPFSVKWEEIMGWFLVPKMGERLTWGLYDQPSRVCAERFEMAVTGRAVVHGIEGVELTAREISCTEPERVINRTFVAQLTDTHCRYLASHWEEDGMRHYCTFLDGDAFMPNWGFGEDNCGNETNLSPKGDIRRTGSVVTHADKPFLLDIVGRYTVTIGGRRYDTVCVMDIETYEGCVVSEQYLDQNGRTVLWRRFNRDDWRIERYKQPWHTLLPDNERITVNGTMYVHWYDCITDYILD